MNAISKSAALVSSPPAASPPMLLPIAGMRSWPGARFEADGSATLPAPLVQALMQLAAASVAVDEDFYLDAQPDVALAIEDGHFSSAQHHYEACGFAEGRQPFRIFVDHRFYLRVYPDVKQQVDAGTVKNAQVHFEQYGWAEGRLPWDGFTLVAQG